MNLDHLPADIEIGVQNCATAMHISHDEAVIKVLETGLTVLQPQLVSSESSVAKSSRRMRDALRRVKLEALSNIPEERAMAAFGAFTNIAGFQGAIESIIAKRAVRYGFSE